MTTVSHTNLIALDLIDCATELRSREEFAREVLLRLQRLIGCQTGAVLSLPSDACPITLGKSSTQQARWSEHGARYTSSLAPLARQAWRQGHVVIDHQVLPLRERDGAPAYAEYFRQNRVCSMLGLFVPVGDSYRHAVGIARYGSDRPFSEQDLAVVRQLRSAISLGIRAFSGSPGDPERAEPGVLAHLNPRELDISLLVARGLRNSEIANVCGISAYTVRNQLVSIFRKLSVSTRAELAALVAVQAQPSG